MASKPRMTDSDAINGGTNHGRHYPSGNVSHLWKTFAGQFREMELKDELVLARLFARAFLDQKDKVA